MAPRRGESSHYILTPTQALVPTLGARASLPRKSPVSWLSAHVLGPRALGIDLRQQPHALAALGLSLGRPVVHADDVQEEIRRVVLRQAVQPQTCEIRRLQR